MLLFLFFSQQPKNQYQIIINIQMFKKQKENTNLSREALEFLNRQLVILRNISDQCSGDYQSVISERILECVSLIEKRIVFSLQNKDQEEFNDFVTDFYESKVSKIRKELEKQRKLNKQLQQQNDSYKFYQTENKKQSRFVSSPRLQAFKLENSPQPDYNLKNQLLHSQKLFRQNQILMQQQNTLIDQLNTYIVKIQSRQSQNRKKFEKKLIQTDNILNQNQKNITFMQKQFDNERKFIEKETRDHQQYNIILIEEKERLEAEVLLKSQQIKLLSKKIYDQTIVLNQYQRVIEDKQRIIQEGKFTNKNFKADNEKRKYQCNELKEKIEKIENSFNKQLKRKDENLAYMEKQLQGIHIQNEELDLTKTNLISNKNTDEKHNKQNISRIKYQVQQVEEKNIKMAKQIRLHEKRMKQNQQTVQQLKEIIEELQQKITTLKQANKKLLKENQQLKVKHYEEKQTIREDISQDLAELVNLNQQVLLKIQLKQSELKSLELEIDTKNKQNNSLHNHVSQLTNSLEELNQNLNQIHQFNQTLQKLKEKAEQQIVVFENKQIENEKTASKLTQLQVQYHIITQQNESLEKIIKKQQKRIEQISKKISQNENDNKDREQLKKYKQQISKKQFQIRQLNMKVTILQQQLREADKSNKVEKCKMNQKIRELEDIIHERFELTNRLREQNLLDSQ